MKRTILTLFTCTSILLACNQNQPTSENAAASAKENNAAVALDDPILQNYLQIENALAKDDGDGAAMAGKALAASVKAFDEKSLSKEQAEIYSKLKDDMMEHAEHIGAHADKIEHQREHFQMLSEDLYDFTKSVGSSQTLYKINCPMYKEKGAFWLTSTKEIQNPYMGKQMSTCGTVKETIE